MGGGSSKAVDRDTGFGGSASVKKGLYAPYIIPVNRKKRQKIFFNCITPNYFLSIEAKSIPCLYHRVFTLQKHHPGFQIYNFTLLNHYRHSSSADSAELAIILIVQIAIQPKTVGVRFRKREYFKHPKNQSGQIGKKFLCY